MRGKVLFISASLLIVVLVFMSTTVADVSHDPAAPIAIPTDQSLEFTLLGSRAGAFAYYSIDYPGDGTVITIELDLAPGDPVAINGAGFNVYGPNGYFLGSGTKSMTKTDRKEFRWADHNPVPWLIQVYNYLDGAPVNFRLQVTGLPDPEPDPTRAPVMLAAQATTFSMTSANLLGDRGGNYHYYKVDSNGSGSEVKLYLYYAPDNHLVSQGFGMNIYAPRDGVLAAHGGHEAKFKLELPGTYLVQVYNYLHGINISYMLMQR